MRLSSLSIFKFLSISYALLKATEATTVVQSNHTLISGPGSFELTPKELDTNAFQSTDFMRSATELQIQGKHKLKSNLPKEAYDHFVNALALIDNVTPEKMSNPWWANKADLHHEIAQLFFKEKQWEQGRSHFFKAVNACRQIPNDKKTLKNWISLSVYNWFIGFSYKEEMNDVVKAKKYISKSKDNLTSDLPHTLHDEANNSQDYQSQLQTIETSLTSLEHPSQEKVFKNAR